MTTQNIIAVYSLATSADIEQGETWYRRAFDFASALTVPYGVDCLTAVGVIAALSPRNRWERNMQDAERMIKVHASGGTFEDLMQLKVCTFNTGKEKAAQILSKKVTDRTELLAILKGPKLIEFFNCIMGDCEDVCIDGHAYSIWAGERITVQNTPNIGVKLRRTIKADYQSAAKQLNVAPCVVQAVTWCAWRRIHGQS